VPGQSVLVIDEEYGFQAPSVAEYLLAQYGNRAVEQFGVLLLDTKHRVLRSTVLSIGVTYLAAILVVALALVAGATGGEGVAWQPVVVLLPLGILALHPRVVAATLRLLRRLTGRELGIPVPSWGSSIGLVALHVPAWLAIGGATWLVAHAIDPSDPDLLNLMFATVLSWVVGLLVVPAPGGVGVREAVFVAAATSLSSSGVAAAVAVCARVIFIVVDLASAAVATLVARHRGRSAERAV
jgi:hypothetical protein